MPRVKWIRTIEGVPLAFPSASSIVEGETCVLGEGEAARAIGSGLAELENLDEFPQPKAIKSLAARRQVEKE